MSLIHYNSSFKSDGRCSFFHSDALICLHEVEIDSNTVVQDILQTEII